MEKLKQILKMTTHKILEKKMIETNTARVEWWNLESNNKKLRSLCEMLQEEISITKTPLT